ncbi:hypothetical protein BRW65_13920 [Mycobacterium paraffinicum]|uniref:Uncharacterized protein n=1 Tax=Mycobacterium paraffinicum TaxID=53378 RepID=A0A1Q4HUK0_9MYCO|nr:hypothetical protein [Mycobacterium paraffinicum]OJZ73373.1 hypothetical protein BRW65_13920 [Mycobacterium paraffinicum]
MSQGHSEIGPELRRLAQSILDGIDPAMRTAAALTAGRGVGTGKCQQVWCPVCALAALATGDQHPLITVIADHSIALLEVVRAMLDDINGAAKPPPDGPPGDGGTDSEAPEAPTRTRYQPIPVTIEE